MRKERGAEEKSLSCPGGADMTVIEGVVNNSGATTKGYTEAWILRAENGPREAWRSRASPLQEVALESSEVLERLRGERGNCKWV